MSKKPNAADIVMNKSILCGGEWITIAQIERDMLAEGFDRRDVDFFLFCLGQEAFEKKQKESEN